MANQKSNFDECLDRVAQGLEAVKQQVALTSELMTISSQQSEQRSTTFDAKLDRINAKIVQQDQLLEKRLQIAEQQSHEVALLADRLLTTLAKPL